MTMGGALRRAAGAARRRGPQTVVCAWAVVWASTLAGCANLPFIGEPKGGDSASPASPSASAPSAAASAAQARADYRFEVQGPPALARLLTQYLDLSRFQTAPDADAIDAAELERLRRAAPAQARGLLETQGYFNATVTAERIDSPGADKPLIRIVVDPGPVTRVTAVDIAATGPLQQSVDAGNPVAQAELDRLRKGWTLMPGEPFLQSAWSSAKSSAIAGVRANGYVAAEYARSAATVDAPANSARLAVEVASGPLYLVGPLRVTGLAQFPPDPVLNLSQFGPGDPYSDKTLLDYQERLQKLGLFEGAAVTLDPSSATSQAAPVEVRVREAPIQQATVGLGYSTNTGPRATLDYTHRRPFGIDWIGTSKIALGPSNQQIDADLTSYPHSNLWRNFVGGTLQRLKTDDQTLDGYTLRVGRSKQDARIDRRYYLEATHATVLNDQLSSSGDAVTANYNWLYRALDNELLPTTGYALTTQTAIGYARGSREVGSGGAQESAKGPLARLYLRLTGWHPLGAWFGSGRIEVGQIISGSPVGIPDTLLFRAGGTDSVRGYGYRQLAPSINGVTVGGRTLMTASIEAAHPIVARHPEFLYAVFIDAGNAADSWKGLSPRVGYGAGLRWRSPVGPLSLDVAYGQAVRQFRVHLSVGVKF